MLEALTLDQLKLFLTVAEERSFSAAGRRLNRVQSAVSYGVAKLEENLGLTLFERSGRSMTLTEAGRALLPDVEAVFEGVGRLRLHADRLDARLETHLIVALEALLPSDFVVALCATFKSAFPTVSLHLRTEGSGGVASVVLDGSCDLGVSGDYDLGEALRSRLLGHLPIVAVAARDHPLARTRTPISSRRLLGEAQVRVTHARYGSGQAQTILSNNVLAVADAQIKLDLITAGFGWGFVPEGTVREAIERKDLVTLHIEERGRAPFLLPIFGIVRRDVQLGPAGQWLYESLAQLSERSVSLQSAA